jgi:hypothetical protein
MDNGTSDTKKSNGRMGFFLDGDEDFCVVDRMVDIERKDFG